MRKKIHDEMGSCPLEGNISLQFEDIQFGSEAETDAKAVVGNGHGSDRENYQEVGERNHL